MWKFQFFILALFVWICIYYFRLADNSPMFLFVGFMFVLLSKIIAIVVDSVFLNINSKIIKSESDIDRERALLGSSYKDHTSETDIKYRHV
jgi:hypothetical protein